MKQKSIKINFFFNILLNISKVLFPLITAPYIARVLEPDGVGLFNFSNVYAGYFALFAALGIPMYGIREVAKIRDDPKELNKFVSEVISISVVSTILCTLAYLISIFSISQLNENSIIFLVAGILLYTTPFRIDWFFSGKEEFGYITIRSLIIKTLSIIALFLFVHQKTDLIYYIIINVCSLVINEIWNYVMLYKAGIRPYFTLSGMHHIKPICILFASVVAASIYTVLDTIMLGFMTDYSQVGFYNSAQHISKSLLPIATSLATVTMPRLSYYFKDAKWDQINDLVKKSISAISFLSFPISFGVICIAPEFVPLFYGEHFVKAIYPLQIIMGVVIAIGFSNLFGTQILLGLGKDKILLLTIIVGTVSNFTLNIFLIPHYGAIGASIASLIAEVLVTAAGYYLVKKTTPIIMGCKKEIFLCFVAVIFFIPIKLLLKQFIDGWILVFAFMFIGSTFYLAFQYFTKNSSMQLFIDLVKKKINRKKTYA